MLVDPLPVKCLSLGAASAISVLSTESFALLDLAPGKSVRKASAISPTGASGPATLTISHSVSKENGVIPTDRLLVRLDMDQLSLDSDIPSGNTKAFAYIVIGTPRGAFDSNGAAFDSVVLFEALLGVVAVSPTAATLSNANLYRMRNGEP